MSQSIFEYKHYKDYLRDRIQKGPNRRRGEKSRIAEVLRCHPTYVSQVLNGSADFSAEQADALNHYLGHDEEEAEFFLLLLSGARAGTVSLRQYYRKKISSVLERRLILKNRLRFEKTLPAEVQVTYFSAWYYAAVHLLLLIPQFQTKEAISARLGLSMNRVSIILNFLVSTGLAEQDVEKFRTGPVSIFLGNESTLISRHHANWRMQAMLSLDRETPEEMHYSSPVTISKADLPAIKEVLIHAIEAVRAKVKQSPSEDLYCYSLDLFKVGPT